MPSLKLATAQHEPGLMMSKGLFARCGPFGVVTRDPLCSMYLCQYILRLQLEHYTEDQKPKIART